MVRDGWVVDKPSIEEPGDLLAMIDRLNQEGVSVYRRLSPPVLAELMSGACEQSAAFHESLDPWAPAAFSVSWAGEEASLNWFDTARELTERWHHQQQIRHATDRPGIMTPDLYHPVLDCFLRGLPYAFRHVEAAEGSRVRVVISGECGGEWQIHRTGSGWKLEDPETECWTSRVTIPQTSAWRVFTKGIDRQSARGQASIEGNECLGAAVLGLTAIVG